MLHCDGLRAMLSKYMHSAIVCHKIIFFKILRLVEMVIESWTLLANFDSSATFKRDLTNSLAKL